LKDYAKKEMIALQSFDPFAVRYLVKHNKDFPCGQLASMGDPAKHSKPNIVLRFMGKLLCTKISHPEFISYDILNTPNEYIQKFLDDGMPVLSWTVNTDEKLALARKHTGNVIFENIRP
jgi:Glycerophosphoryl diester phosphodiesterase